MATTRLSPTQVLTLAKLKTSVSALDYPEKHTDSWFKADSDQICLRFLRARDFDFDKAYAMLAAHLEWRSTVNPSSITFSQPNVRNLLTMDGGSWRYAGRGKLGHPILLTHAGRFHPARADPDTYLQLQVAQHEYFNALLKRDPKTNPVTGEVIDSGIVFLDFTGWSLTDQGSTLKYSRILADVANQQYPETLHVAIVWQAGLFMRSIWTVIKPWLAEKTQRSVVFINDPKDLLEYIDASELLPEYGGTRKEAWPLPV